MKKPFEEFKSFIKGKKVAVVGIGVSNIPLIRFLVKLGAEVTAFDKKSKEDLGEIAEEFEITRAKRIAIANYFYDFDDIYNFTTLTTDSNTQLLKEKAEIIL